MSNLKKEASIFNSEEHLFNSKYINDEFRICVSLPNDYHTSHKVYPVVYLLDSNIFYSMVTDIARLLQFGNEIPQLIIVGIGYPNENEHLKLRNRDYLPTHNPISEMSGGADNFLKFLIDELKPFIEDNYRVKKNDCVLAGDSYSGLFGLYTLFHKPKSFNKYIIGSPSIYWDNEVILSHEEDYATKNDELNATVFISAGELEAVYEPSFAKMVSNVVNLYNILENRHYKGLKLVKHIFDGETHLSVIPATMSRGLRVVFQSDKLEKPKFK